MSELTIVALVQAKPGHEAALVHAQAHLVTVVRTLPGCMSYELHEALDRPGQVVFFERWKDHASWERHMRGAHMDAFRAKVGAMIGGFELLQMRKVI
ncbi:putative quinol monooxygenase [Lysobacter terrae]